MRPPVPQGRILAADRPQGKSRSLKLHTVCIYPAAAVQLCTDFCLFKT